MVLRPLCMLGLFALHTLLRFDAGNATLFYQPKDVYQYVPVKGTEVGEKIAIPGYNQTGLLLTFGGGFRF